jgi:hypothetical protein
MDEHTTGYTYRPPKCRGKGEITLNGRGYERLKAIQAYSKDIMLRMVLSVSFPSPCAKLGMVEEDIYIL